MDIRVDSAMFTGPKIYRGCVFKHEQFGRAVAVCVVGAGVGWLVAQEVGAVIAFVLALHLQRGVRRIVVYPIKRNGLEDSIRSFVERGVNDDRLYMQLAGRQMNVYKEILQDGTVHYGVELPWEAWRDIYSEDIRLALANVADKEIEIVEGNNGVYVQTDGVAATADIVLYLMRLLETSLKGLRMNFFFRRRGSLGKPGFGEKSRNEPGTPGIEK